MLQLPMRTEGELVILHDHTDDSRAYACRLRPRLSSGTSGRPSLRLVHWTSTEADASGEHEVGGHLFVEIDVEPSATELAAAGVPHAQPIPWLEAKAVLDLPGAEPVSSEVSVVAGGRASFSLALTPQQVNVLAPLLGGDQVSPLQVTWVGTVRARLPAVEVTVLVDTDERRRTSTTSTTTLTREWLRTHATIVIEGAADPELEAALQQWALDELERRAEAGEDLQLSTSAADVGAWPIRLPTTLDLHALRGTEVVTSLALPPDELGERPPVTVRAIGPVGTEIDRVDVELRPPGGPAITLALADAEPAAADLPRGPYELRHRVVQGGLAWPWSSWREAGSIRDHSIPVVVPAPRTVEVLLAGLDLQQRWSSIRVELSADGPSPSSTVIELHEGTRTGSWALPSGSEGAAVRARTTFVSRQGLEVPQGPELVEHDQLLLRDPFGHHRLQVTLVPVGAGWQGVALAMIDLRHEDGSYTHEQAGELRGLGEVAKVVLPSRPEVGTTYQWRLHASYEDGRFVQTQWKTSTSAMQPVMLPPPSG